MFQREYIPRRCARAPDALTLVCIADFEESLALLKSVVVLREYSQLALRVTSGPVAQVITGT